MRFRGHLGVVKSRVALLVVEDDRADDLELPGVRGEILLCPVRIRVKLEEPYAPGFKGFCQAAQGGLVEVCDGTGGVDVYEDSGYGLC